MKKIKIGDCAKVDFDDILIAKSEVQTICLNMDGDSYRGLYVHDMGDNYAQCSEESFLENLYPTLHLPIGNDAKKYGGCWFALILGGVKKEEYREFFGMDKGSPINIKTLVAWQKEDWQWLLRSFVERSEFMYDQISFKPWKVLHLTNGYGHDKPQLWAHIESISIGRGNPEWGAPTDRDVFIIRIGEVFHSKNLKAK